MNLTNISSPIPVTVRVGSKELLNSAVVHLEGKDEVSVAVAHLAFIFRFRSDEGAARYAGTQEGSSLYLDLFNHTNPLGEGLLQPVELAVVNGRTLSVTYYVNTLNAEKKSRRFEFAFYLEAAQ